MAYGGSQALGCIRSAAASLMQPLAWEPPYAEGVALEKAEKQNKRKSSRRHHITGLAFAEH